MWGAFVRVGEEAQAQLRTIVEKAAASNPAPGTDARRIGDFYAIGQACLGLPSREYYVGSDDAKLADLNGLTPGFDWTGWLAGAGLPVNGELTLGENIADDSGVAIAYKACKISLNGKKSPVLDGFTGE